MATPLPRALFVVLVGLVSASLVAHAADGVAQSSTTTTRAQQQLAELKPGELRRIVFARPEAQREIYVYAPKGYSESRSWPLAFFFHGYTGDYREGMLLGMMADADRAGYLMAFGQGTRSSQNELGWNGGVCCLFANGTGTVVDDVAYTRTALAMIKAIANVDSRRVYAMGFSNGGFMAERLACEASELWAGIAANAGAVGIEPGGQEGLAKCDKSYGQHAVSILLLHGAADVVIFWTGTEGQPPSLLRGVPATLDDAARWNQRMGCSAKVMQTYNDGVFSNLVWPDCRGGSSLELMTVRNGTHVWWTKGTHGFGTTSYALEFFNRIHKKKASLAV